MKKSFLLILLTISISLFSEVIGVEETVKGYINLYLLSDDGDKLNLLDNGIYLNSRIYIKDSDKRFYLREHGDYVVNILEDSLNIKWRVDTLEIIEKYSKTNKGFIYSIDIKNRTNENRNVGVYLMYDTYLGEDSGDHFILNSNKIVKKERTFYSTEIPLSVKSTNLRGQGIEFRIMDTPYKTPELLILGNWDRLAYSKKWPYKPDDGGLFSYGYYSINDSGIGIVYPGVNILPNTKISYSFNINLLKDNTPSEVVETKELIVPNPKNWTIEKETSIENVEIEKSEVSNDEVDEVIEPLVVPETTVTDSEKEEFKKMLEYIQKKKLGEDVSGYGFDEEYIMKKLKERDE